MQRKKKSYLSVTMGAAAAVLMTFVVVTACSDTQAKAKPNIITKDTPPAPGVVATIGGQNITEDELIGDAKMDFFEIKKQEYDKRMERLNQLIIQKLVGEKAKEANMPLEDFISKKVVGGDIKISQAQYDKFVAEKKIPKEQINPQIKERINSYLQQMKRQELIEAYVAKLTKNNPVEVYFQKPKMEVNVDIGKAPVWGKENAKVTIIEFSDFQCPFCSRAAKTVSELKKKYAGKIKIAYKQFPLPMHQNARPTAEASMCVAEQGNDKFWKFHDITFENQEKLSPEDVAKYAKEAGADPKAFADCVAAHKFADYVAQDMETGNKAGVRSTPTFLINGQIIAGAVPIENFSEVIDDALANSK
jgi:protein-disulfide isomerase